MSTINITHPDGTRGTYTITNPQTWAAIQAVKPAKKTRIKPAKRKYPDWRADMTTREYIRAYFALNTRRDMCAYDDGQDHTALYACANMDRAPTWAPDTVTVEIDA